MPPFFFLLVFLATAGNNLFGLHVVQAQQLPSGFRDEGVVFVSGATAFNFAPKEDGGQMLLICAKRGRLVVSSNPDTDSTSNLVDVLDMQDRICNNGERGLQSVLAHPNFLQNRWIYLYYAYDKFGGCGLDSETGAVNRLSRFVLDEDLEIDLNTEVVLLETSPLPNRIHNGGDMHFGKDGYLYLTIGDGGGRDNSEPQNLSFLLGSLIRITDTGGIPSGNPYTGSGTTRCNEGGRAAPGVKCQEIFASGLRNPFRMAQSPHTLETVTEFWINDVGGSKWEEINRAGSGFPAANYGYREREGPCRVGSVTNCNPSASYMDPIYWYQHDQKDDGAITGGAFVPNGLWPSGYDRAYLYSDFIYQRIYVLSEDSDNGCRTCSPPRPGYTNETFFDLEDIGQPVQLTFGPYLNTQALYYSNWAPSGTNIRRIIYEGSDNRSPTAAIQVSATEGLIGTEIEFDGSGSTDPDGDELSYSWEFGDGESSSQIGPSHVYDASGNYVVSLVVTDGSGFQSTSFITIIIGDPPIPSIESPIDGTEFAVGDIFTLVGSAVDGMGNSLPSSSLTWEVRQHHSTHWHPFLDATPGNNIIIDPAPPPEDFQASQNSFLKILLTATDTNGFSATVEMDVYPKIVLLEFSSDPPELELILDGFGIRTPTQEVSWENHNIVINAPDQDIYYFVSWSDGGDRTHTINVQQTDTTFNAVFAIQQMPSSLPSPSPMQSMPTIVPATQCVADVCRKIRGPRGSKLGSKLSLSNGRGGAAGRASGRLLRRENARGG